LGYDLPHTHLSFYTRHQPQALALGCEDVLLVGSLRVVTMLSPLEDYDSWFRIPGA
jgi:hypothetical protein